MCDKRRNYSAVYNAQFTMELYDAYGNMTIRNGSGNVIPSSAYGNRFLFQGREYDYTTQLYHFRARWYDSETGRWLSNDPIGISGGLNLYAFCANNPVCFVDPMGLSIGGLYDTMFKKAGYGNRNYVTINYQLASGEQGSVTFDRLSTFINFMEGIKMCEDLIVDMTMIGHGGLSSDNSGSGILFGTMDEDGCTIAPNSGKFYKGESTQLGAGSDYMKELLGAVATNANIRLYVCYGASTAESINTIRGDLTITGYTDKVYCLDDGSLFFIIVGKGITY